MALFGLFGANRVHDQPLTFAIEGKTYKVGRVRICDLAALQERIRDQRIDALFRHKAKITSTEVFAKTLAGIISNDPTEEDVFTTASTQEGQAFLLWRGITQYQPGVELEKVREWTEKYIEVAATQMRESGLVPEGGGGSAAENPTPREPQSTGPKTPACFQQPTAGPQPKSES